MLFVPFRHTLLFRRTAVLALWLLLFPALVPFVHHPAARTAAAAPTMPLCHMAMGDTGDQPRPDASKAQKPCPICQSLDLLAQGFVAPPAPVLAAPVFASASAVLFPERTPAGNGFVSFWPRGPPALA